jgi:hypothetical protein
MEQTNALKGAFDRRSFVKNGLTAAGLATAGVGLLSTSSSVLADEEKGERSGRLSRGDAALLRFAAAAEILETDFWVQYNELCGIPDNEVPGGSGNPAFTTALSVLDSDMAQYVHDNTDDEFTHQNFLNAYLVSKGADPVNLEPFRTLMGSTATGSSGKLRLTNLMELTLDTSWWTRYRSDSNNPDLDPSFTFLRPYQPWRSASILRSPGRMLTRRIRTSCRQLQIRLVYTCLPSNKAATACIRRWRKEPAALRC